MPCADLHSVLASRATRFGVHCAAPRRHRGVALVIGLIVVLLVTILAIFVVQLVNSQSRMADAARDQAVSFQAAETALRSAEARIASRGAPYDPFDRAAFSADCRAANCLAGPLATPSRTALDWSPIATTTVAVALSLPAGVDAPRYRIELVSGGEEFDPSTGCAALLFRITARGFGPGGLATDLQSVYRLRPDAC